MTRKTRITASLATLVVAAAAGSTVWGVIAQSPASATPPAGACYIDEDPNCNDTPGTLDPGIAGACYIEDPNCNDTPGFLDPPVAVDPLSEAPAPAEPVQPDAGLIAPGADVPDTIDPLA
jgi:hypothetical protein